MKLINDAVYCDNTDVAFPAACRQALTQYTICFIDPPLRPHLIMFVSAIWHNWWHVHGDELYDVFKTQNAKFPLFIPALVSIVTSRLSVPWYAGGGLAGLGRHGTLFPVFLLDHNEDQPEDQRQRQLQVHWHPGHLRLWELWGESSLV